MSNVHDILGRLKKIESTKNTGNWVERIVNSMTRQSQQTLVHPCVINGEQTLVYERGLKESNPLAYEQIAVFAEARGYQLKEDRRANFLDGIKRVKDRHRRNVVSVMVLTASLMSQGVYAKPKQHDDHDRNYHGMDNMTQSQIEARFDLDLESFNTEAELASGLLGWINQHSSISYDLDKIPDIKKVSAQQIAEIAFGGKLPKAINPANLQIYGLYNFNEEAVYLLDSIDLETNAGKAILLHELVHFLQYQTGMDKDAKCKNELESLAYVLEAKFLNSQHHKHNITRSHINKVSQCRV